MSSSAETSSDNVKPGPGFPERLSEGYRAFLGDRFGRERARWEAVAEGQSPSIMVISCCDSRVAPELVFDARPGELFVMRNVSNLVPPFETGGEYHATSAALEFAVQALKVQHIVVLGHARCGGIRAFADQAAPLSPGNFIGKWVNLVAPAAERLGEPPRVTEDYLTRLELASIEVSLDNLMTFPCIRILVERGKLALHGAYFGVASGRLLIRDPQTGVFEDAAPGQFGTGTPIRCV